MLGSGAVGRTTSVCMRSWNWHGELLGILGNIFYSLFVVPRKPFPTGKLQGTWRTSKPRWMKLMNVWKPSLFCWYQKLQRWPFYNCSSLLFSLNNSMCWLFSYASLIVARDVQIPKKAIFAWRSSQLLLEEITSKSIELSSVFTNMGLHYPITSWHRS